MAQQPPPVRRVVTGNGPDGRARIVEDALATRVRTVAARPGYRVSNLWATCDSPAPINDPDRIGEIRGVLPPANGTVVRIIDYPPEPRDPAVREAMQRAAFAELFPDATHHPTGGPHPGMHETDTVDYAIVMAGEIYAVMDEGETLLRAGDVLIQRGTNHAWSNRSDDYCRICFVLIDGRR
jgi:hypothetical protein